MGELLGIKMLPALEKPLTGAAQRIYEMLYDALTGESQS